jgi:hypothetical protein
MDENEIALSDHGLMNSCLADMISKVVKNITHQIAAVELSSAK